MIRDSSVHEALYIICLSVCLCVYMCLCMCVDDGLIQSDETALHISAQNGFRDCAKQLLAFRHVDVDMKNKVRPRPHAAPLHTLRHCIHKHNNNNN